MDRQARTRLTTCALLFACTSSLPAFAQVNTPNPVGVDNRQLPRLDDADLQQASITFHPGSAGLALQLEQASVDRKLWRSPITQVIRALEAAQSGDDTRASGGLGMRVTIPGTPGEQARPTPPPEPIAADDVVLIDHSWLTGRMRAQRLVVDGRKFYFIVTDPSHITDQPAESSRRPSSRRGRLPPRPGDKPGVSRYVVVAVEEDASTPPALFRTEGEPPIIHENATPHVVAPFPGPGEFSAVPWDDGIAVIYRDRGGIFARRLNIQGNTLAFEEEPRQLANAPDTIARYQLLARTGDNGTVHLAWAMVAADDGTTLHYCRLLPRGRSGCDRQAELSSNIAVSERLSPINLMVRGEHVYLSWVDTRYISGRLIPRNFAKLLIAASADGGRTFAAPVAINRPRDDSDNARYALTLPAKEGGVLVYWTTEMVQGGWWQRRPFRAGWLDAGLKQFRIGNAPIPGEHIEAVLEQGALTYHQNLGR